MWHEARKQERRIRGLIVDYRRRAERRQDFYERIQADPTQFIQVHGRRCKIHLDPAVAAAGDGAAIIVPWQGQNDNLIDRFDVRAHLDYIPSVLKSTEIEAEPTQEERQCNYERYRILAQNDFLNITEEKFLNQLNLEEQFGANVLAENPSIQGKKKPQKTGAAIGYTYDDPVECSGDVQPFSHLTNVSESIPPKKLDKGSETESDSDIDMDVSIDISKIDTIQAHELNACGRNYGMLSNDFYSYLTKDADEADALRIAREEQHEKLLLSGRKSRRERKAQKERRIANRPFSPPSYAAKEDKSEQVEESESRSPSPTDTTEKITYITSFGGEDELHPHSKISINLQKKSGIGEGASTSTTGSVRHPTYADKVKENLHKMSVGKEANRKRSWKHSSSDSRSRSRSKHRSRRSRRSYRRTTSSESSCSRNRKYDRRRSRTRSRSISRIYSSRRYKSMRRKSGSRSRYRRYRSTSTNSVSSNASSRRNRGSMKRSKYKQTSRARSSSRKRSRSSSIRSKDKHKSSSIKRKSLEKHEPEIKPVISLPETAADITTTNTTTTPTTTTTNVEAPIASAEASIHVFTAPSAIETEVIEPPPPPLKRYYGRKRDQYSPSSESDSEPEESKPLSQILPTPLELDATAVKGEIFKMSTSLQNVVDKQTGKYTGSSNEPPSNSNSATESKVTSGSGRMNLRERLKRKMQNLLNKQYKADKKAEIEKTEREKQLQQEREEEMRELSLKLRRRQRKLRHRHGSANSIETTSEISESVDRERDRDRERDKLSPTDSNDLLKRQSCERPSGSATKKRSYRDRHHSRSRSRYRSRSRERSHSRSRGSSRHRSNRYRAKSRSPSRARRSCSRRRYHTHRDRRNRERSAERSLRRSGERSYKGSRHRRSPSRSDRPYNQQDDDYRSNRKSNRRISEREQRPHDRRHYQEDVKSTTSSILPPGISRSRAVISAPPKLKKLVDY